MAKRNWKKVYPTSLRNAMELCVDYARESKRNLNVERIADLMGLENHFTLYKWLENARMPALMIRPFEHACGIDFVTRHLAHSNNKLYLDMPTGKAAEHRDISALSIAMHETCKLLAEFYTGHGDAHTQIDVIANLTAMIEDLAYQRGNVEKTQQPELELGE